jgi:predicted Zn-dependent peptidase
MIHFFELSPGVTLQCFPDHRFKQSALSIQFVRPMCREEAALNALLPAVLLRGSESCPDLRRITLRLDDLYGASVGALVRRVGDYQTTGLHASFIEDRYALQNDQILAPMVDFIRELLFQPVLENGLFRQDFVESEKRNLIATIESQKNDKRAYAGSQMIKKMCKADSFGVPRLGEKEQVAAITAQSLFDHYRKVLQESPVHLFYVGSAQPEKIAQLLKPLFLRDAQLLSLPPQTPYRDSGKGDYTETLDVAQGKLCMGFVTDITLRDPDFAVMQVFNALYGAGMTSKLFMQVREKLSLCYDIGTGYHGSKGIITLSAGIDFDQYDRVRQEVMTQLEACCREEISPEELTAAKQALIAQLRSTHDSPGAIEGYYATSALSGLSLTPAEYMQAVAAVTCADVARVAKRLQLHTVYFLKGVK